MRPKGQFKIGTHRNASGSTSYRVSGTKMDGTRVSRSFSGNNAEAIAKAEKNALEIEALNNGSDERLRPTTLTAPRLRLAEVAFGRLDHEEDILRAVDLWNEHGKQRVVEKAVVLSKAVEDFAAWLDATKELRDHSKRNLKTRLGLFAADIAHLHIADITAEHVQTFLKSRAKWSATTRDNDKRAVSRFFTWCIEQKWLQSNPCATVTVSKGEAGAPAILSVEQCQKLMAEAEKHEKGRLVRYIALCLFGKLRPFEAMRLEKRQINLADDEIRLEATQTKTGRVRVVTIDKTLKAWLARYQGPVWKDCWRKDFDAVKEAAGLLPWVPDILRHTGISHFFRKTGSYGLTAEQAGNSEAIIKAHYQARTGVSSADTRRFYAILPKQKRKSRKIIDLPSPETSRDDAKSPPALDTKVH